MCRSWIILTSYRDKQTLNSHAELLAVSSYLQSLQMCGDIEAEGFIFQCFGLSCELSPVIYHGTVKEQMLIYRMFSCLDNVQRQHVITSASRSLEVTLQQRESCKWQGRLKARVHRNPKTHIYPPRWGSRCFFGNAGIKNSLAPFEETVLDRCLFLFLLWKPFQRLARSLDIVCSVMSWKEKCPFDQREMFDDKLTIGINGNGKVLEYPAPVLLDLVVCHTIDHHVLLLLPQHLIGFKGATLSYFKSDQFQFVIFINTAKWNQACLFKG